MSKWLKLVALTVAIVSLVGCSAGGGDKTTGGTSGSGSSTGGTTAGTLSLSLSSVTIASGAPSTVTATAKNGSGGAAAGVVINFAVSPQVGTLSSTAALTDASGVASVLLSPASAQSSGADTVTASASIGGTTVTASAGYQLSATTAAISSFASDAGTTANSSLPPYAQAVLTANLSGVSAAAPVTLTVTSACVVAGKATISPTTTQNSSGVATFTYKDTGGCGSSLASDTVTLSAGNVSKSTQIFLTSPTANSITFTSATPNLIYLKGSGNIQSSTVKFQVVDTSGNPLPNQVVTLNLSTFAGGLELNQGTSPVTETSDAGGYVTAIVNSGTVPTPVRVTATLASGVTTVSSNLAVVTGLPSQLNFSLSQKTTNIEGWNYDGVPNTYTIYAADRSGNPVPDGTSVLFWAEGGQVQGTASTTTSGGISGTTVNYVSSSPRPSDGRVTILAYTIGEESFADLAGTNVYQSPDPYQDLGNVVKSRLFDGIYDPANDEVVSLSAVGATSSGSACTTYASSYAQFALNNTIPNQPNTCDAAWTGKTYVRRAIETVLSSTRPNPMVSSALLPTGCTVQLIYPAPQTLSSQVRMFPLLSNSTLYVGTGTTQGAFQILATDDNAVRLNPMAAGSTISATPGPGLDSATVATSSGQYTYPSTSAAQTVPINFTFHATTVTPTSGAASGVPVTTYDTVASMTLNFTSAPSGTTTSMLVGLRAMSPGNCQ